MRIVLAALAAALCVDAAQAGALVDLEIVARASGGALQQYRHGGRSYVAGDAGAAYSVRLINRSSQRVLAVLSVDGVNVVSGETAHPSQSGYVLEPWGSYEIRGWRKSMAEVAQFYFTNLADSYAARTGRPDNVGVIGVAAFREARPQPLAQPMPRPEPQEMARRDAAPAPAAPAERAAATAPQAAAGASADAVESSAKTQARKDERLGTGHGAREYSPTRHTQFERASDRPDEVVRVYYDSYAHLSARGIIPGLPRYAEPQAFPGRFVPDPGS
ncbi:MAG: hypothetical protein KF778_16745 [Rhodocyclaceae bacterium]|nr:hypothetical protein [Rhodocyclaceae bacterium]MBX3670051.1 hypothetical protein [Rhodocyclaceae bacterium]